MRRLWIVALVVSISACRGEPQADDAETAFRRFEETWRGHERLHVVVWNAGRMIREGEVVAEEKTQAIVYVDGPRLNLTIWDPELNEPTQSVVLDGARMLQVSGGQKRTSPMMKDLRVPFCQIVARAGILGAHTFMAGLAAGMENPASTIRMSALALVGREALDGREAIVLQYNLHMRWPVEMKTVTRVWIDPQSHRIRQRQIQWPRPDKPQVMVEVYREFQVDPDIPEGTFLTE